jgi:hypothetical protein
MPSFPGWNDSQKLQELIVFKMFYGMYFEFQEKVLTGIKPESCVITINQIANAYIIYIGFIDLNGNFPIFHWYFMP